MLSEPIKEGEDGLCAPGCLISAGKARFREVFCISASAWQTSCTCWNKSWREREDSDWSESSWDVRYFERKWESGRKLSREAAIGKGREKHVIRSENEAAKA